MNEQKAYIYDAFISYRHTEPDKEVAEKLHRMLETYRVPRSIVNATGKKHIKRVFRDRDELPTSSNLADNITTALENSEYLIVICSPRTPQSQWVIKEIETFSALHGHDRILALLVEGEPQESFPPQLRYVKKTVTTEDGLTKDSLIEIEPLAADIRAHSTKEMFKKLKSEILRLLAPMLSCKYDDLKQRHRERVIKTIVTASVSLSAFFLLFGSVSTYQALVINQKSKEVIAQSEIRKITQSLYLSDISEQLREEGDRYRAILVALEALPDNLDSPERPYVQEAELALSQALSVYEVDSYYDGDKVIDHDKPVNFIKSSPNRKVLMTSCRDGYLYTWSTEDGTAIGSYQVNDYYLEEGEAFFLDDERILFLADGKPIGIDIKGNKLWESEESVWKIALSTDNQRLAYADTEKFVLIDTSSGSKLMEVSLKNLLDGEPFGNYVTTLCFNLTGSTVSIGTSYGKVLVMDTQGKPVLTFDTEYENVSSIVYNSEGKMAVASNRFDSQKPLSKGEGVLQVFTLESPQPLITTPFPYSHIEQLQFISYDPTQLMLVESEKLNLLDIQTGEILNTFIHGDSISEYLISEDIAVSASQDGSVRFWMFGSSGLEADTYRITRPYPIMQLAAGKGVFAISYHNDNKVYLLKPLENENTIKLPGHTESISGGEFSPDGSITMTYDFDQGELFLWDPSGKKLIRSITLNDGIREAHFTKDGSSIVVLTDKKTLKLIKTSDLSIVKEVNFTDGIGHLYAESSRVAIDYFNQITILDMNDLQEIGTLDTNTEDIYFTEDGQAILFDRSSGISVFDIKSGSRKAVIESKEINTVTLSPDGHRMAVAYKDKSVKLYEVNSGFKELLTLTNIKYPVVKMIISPDSKLLYIGMDDFTVSVYQTDDGTLKGVIGNFTNALDRVVYSSDQKKILVVAGNKNTQLWDIASFKQLASFSRIIDIDAGFQTLLSSWYTDIIFMPLYDTRMLLEEAQKQLNGRVLTDEERRKLFIEP